MAFLTSWPNFSQGAASGGFWLRIWSILSEYLFRAEISLSISAVPEDWTLRARERSAPYADIGIRLIMPTFGLCRPVLETRPVGRGSLRWSRHNL